MSIRTFAAIVAIACACRPSSDRESPRRALNGADLRLAVLQFS